MPAIDKDKPSADWIAAMRKKFVTEAEIDLAMTDKLKRRLGPVFKPPTFEEILSGLRALIGANLSTPFDVRDARWLSGGTSKLQVAFTLDWTKPGFGRTETRMVLRIEPAESVHATSRLREYQIVKALQGVLPVPEVYWVDARGEYLPYPGLIYGHAPGVTKPSEVQAGVGGLGTRLPVALRARLGEQFVRDLAILHAHDFSGADLSAFTIPRPGKESTEWAISWWDRVWEEDAGQEVPLVSLTSAWLRKNAPPVEHLSIIHGDFRVGNFLFDEPSVTITSWLDWELARIGDRHQDLAWCTSPAYGSYDENGIFLVTGLMPEEKLLEDYERLSGLNVDRKSLRYFQIFNAYSMVAMTLGTCYRVAKNGRSHQDVLLTWLLGVGYVAMDHMRELIEKEQ